MLEWHLDRAQQAEAGGDWVGAIAAYDAALAEAPALAEAHFNRANLLHRTGRIAEALAAFDLAIAGKPDWAAPHLNRGALLTDQGKPEAALPNLRRATRLSPDDAQAWSNLGNALSRLGRHAAALDAHRDATKAAPENPVARYNLGNAFTAAGQIAASALAYAEALRLAPHFAPAAVNLAARLRTLGDAEAARHAAEHAVRTAPSLPAAHQALGCVCIDLGEFANAENALRIALAQDPNLAGAAANLGLVLAALGRFEEAHAPYHAALAQDPADPQAAFGQACTFLAQGDYASGWSAFAARKRMPGAPRRRFRAPAWRGEPVPGETIQLYAEEGFGDTLQFLRFAPLVAARAGARVMLQVQPALVRLCACLPHIARVFRTGVNPDRYDRACGLLDLAEFFAPSLEALAPAAPYLTADPALVAARALAPGEGMRVGLCWAGQSRPDQPQAFAMDRRRSLRAEDLLRLRRPHWRMISLQLGAPTIEGLENPMHWVKNFADTAAIVAQLDLVIAVDTAAAHLAAAMGKPVWLLSRYDACWRWLRNREDSPWYPTLRVFRQPAPNDWAGALAAAKSAPEPALFADNPGA